MGLWENNLAASLTYQDLGDCSLGSLPAVTELETVKEQKKDKNEVTSLQKKKKDMAVIKIMKRACGVLIMVAVGMIAKFM